MKVIRSLWLSLFTLVTFISWSPGSAVLGMWNGLEYSKNSLSQQKDAEAVLEKIFLAYEAVPPKKILDVGCGDGKMTAKLAQHFKDSKVVGIDLSDSMIEFAKKSQLPAPSGNLDFYQADVRNFKSPEKFNLIVAFHVLHWVKEQKEALDNIYAHLAPGGRIYFILAPSKEGLPFSYALEKLKMKFSDEFSEFKNTQNFYDLENYRKLLVQSSLHILGLHYVYNQKEYESAESLNRWIRQWLPHAKHLANNPQKQDEFMTELVDAYLKEIGLNKGAKKIPWGEYVMIVEAVRLK